MTDCQLYFFSHPKQYKANIKAKEKIPAGKDKKDTKNHFEITLSQESREDNPVAGGPCEGLQSLCKALVTHDIFTHDISILQYKDIAI